MSIMQLRSRIIRPDFFTSQKLTDLGDKTMVVYAGLWIIADREGRLEDSPKLIRAFTRPFDDDCDTESILQSLHDSGFIDRYSVDGSRYIQVCNWHEMQTIHHNERKSQIPPSQQLAGSSEARPKQGSSNEPARPDQAASTEVKEEVVKEEEGEAKAEAEVSDTEDLPWDENNQLRRVGRRQI